MILPSFAKCFEIYCCTVLRSSQGMLVVTALQIQLFQQHLGTLQASRSSARARLESRQELEHLSSISLFLHPPAK